MTAETARYKKIPQITDFTDENGTDHMKQVVQENYERIKAEAGRIVAEELERIKNDPVLCKLLPEQNLMNTNTPANTLRYLNGGCFLVL